MEFVTKRTNLRTNEKLSWFLGAAVNWEILLRYLRSIQSIHGKNEEAPLHHCEFSEKKNQIQEDGGGWGSEKELCIN